MDARSCCDGRGLTAMERLGGDHAIGENPERDESDRKPPRLTPLPARAWLMRARDEDDLTVVSSPDLWRVFLEPPVPAAGQELPATDAPREPETHYGTRSELEAIAAAYGVEETYVWSPGSMTYRLQT